MSESGEEGAEMIRLEGCKPRYVYRIKSRNLVAGVYTGKDGGFIGIRYKFGKEYLFTEYHYDTGAPYGTVMPKAEVAELPKNIELRETNPTVCSVTKERCEWRSDTDEGESRGKWYYVGRDEVIKGIPVATTYKPLFDYLKSIEATIPLDERRSVKGRDWMPH